MQEENNFPYVLFLARTSKGLSQEGLQPQVSRTYISQMERRLKQPTLGKVDEIASKLEVHPLTLLGLSYLKTTSRAELDILFKTVRGEILTILEKKKSPNI